MIVGLSVGLGLPLVAAAVATAWWLWRKAKEKEEVFPPQPKTQPSKESATVSIIVTRKFADDDEAPLALGYADSPRGKTNEAPAALHQLSDDYKESGREERAMSMLREAFARLSSIPTMLPSTEQRLNQRAARPSANASAFAGMPWFDDGNAAEETQLPAGSTTSLPESSRQGGGSVSATEGPRGDETARPSFEERYSAATIALIKAAGRMSAANPDIQLGLDWDRCGSFSAEWFCP